MNKVVHYNLQWRKISEEPNFNKTLDMLDHHPESFDKKICSIHESLDLISGITKTNTFYLKFYNNFTPT